MTFVNIVVAVWGESFTKIFLDLALENQLSEKNIPDLLKIPKVKYCYKIYTSTKDAVTIRSHNNFKRLSELLSIDVEEKVLGDLSDAVGVATGMHDLALKAAIENKAATIFLTPDIVIADGSLTYIVNSYLKGNEAVFLGNYRVNRESFLPAVENSAALNSRDLVRLSLDHLHPFTKELFITDSNFSRWPSICLWPIKQNQDLIGVVMHVFHPHPILVSYKLGADLTVSIDGGELVNKVTTQNIPFELIDDSDKAMVVEFTSQSRRIESKAMTHKIKRLIYVALFTLFHCHKTHVRLAKRTIMFHSQDLNSDCHRVKTEADSDMAFIFKARAAMRGPWLFVDLLRWSLIKLKLFDPIHDQTPLIVFAYKKVYVWRDKFLNHPWCGMRLIGKTMVAITRLKRKLLSGRENFNAL